MSLILASAGSRLTFLRLASGRLPLVVPRSFGLRLFIFSQKRGFAMLPSALQDLAQINLTSQTYSRERFPVLHRTCTFKPLPWRLSKGRHGASPCSVSTQDRSAVPNIINPAGSSIFLLAQQNAFTFMVLTRRGTISFWSS